MGENLTSLNKLDEKLTKTQWFQLIEKDHKDYEKMFEEDIKALEAH